MPRPPRQNSPEQEAPDDQEIVIVGRIGAAYGVKGWVHIQSFTEPPDNILAYNLFIAREQRWEELDVRLQRHRDGFIGKITRVDDRDAAKTKSGTFIGADPIEFSQAADDEVLWRDLVGLQVRNTQGHAFGTVQALTETGNHDVLVIRSQDGEETLIPFAEEFIEELSLHAGTLVVDWGEDW